MGRNKGLTLSEKLLSRIAPDGDCVVWIGGRQNQGYGEVWDGERNRMFRAHRAAFEIFIGPIPSGIQVLHTCDNPPCIKLEHLFLGTHQDNMDDKVLKNRQAHAGVGAKGSKNGRSKLNETQIKDIRKYLDKGISYNKIANIFNVSDTLIYNIKNKKNWKHV